jgi:hypothetical protein
MSSRHALRALAAAAAALVLSGCATQRAPEAGDVAGSPWAVLSAGARPGDAPAQPWAHYALPGKAQTQFRYARKEGRDALAVLATSSASMMRQKVAVPPSQLGSVHFSWLVPELIADADIALRDADDAPVRVILAFDGDRSKFSPRDAMMSELARALTGEEMPYATRVYSWCNKREPGTVIRSPRTERVRTLVVESGPRRLNRWLEYDRDIRADYEKAFGEAPGALVGIALMTDSDNTQSTTRAWYGPVRLQPTVTPTASAR